MVRVCILFAAGTNCETETADAFEYVGAVAEVVHINRFRQRQCRLDGFDILVIPGGFSYGDYIASGRILANELRHSLKEEIEGFLAAGRLILGICNGFQVLVKCGLLPGLSHPFEPQSVTLDANDSFRYEDRWVHLRVEHSPCVFTRGLPDTAYLPVAHAEGKFAVGSSAVLDRLNRHGLVALRYVTAAGGRAGYPDNPNGSVQGIAGICDPTGRVFGLMPHPERYTRPTHHPSWSRKRPDSPHGVLIFENAVSYVKENC
uniref:Phosphoribosylformylglycinamidine synthase I n=1 Tax=candidate division WOR-3 bacterium TaxID=2052148 RepID=A0A7C4CDH3_UNCW3